MLSVVVMLNFVMLSIVLLSVVMLSAVESLTVRPDLKYFPLENTLAYFSGASVTRTKSLKH